ncbi:MAG: pyrimidine reductase [Saprospiraceae bacterium]|nr:MAG: pyrimidine reductase [Saprospiraceae bacterium]
MRKLKLQVQTSVDNFIAGPNGEMDWMTWNWDEELNKYVKELTEPVDCIILGRKLAEGFIPTWTSRAADPKTAEDFGREMVDTAKIVFTKTMHNADWENTTLEHGDLAEKVNELKQQSGGDIIAYGGSEFVSSLIKEELIDEYHLFVNPTAIGKGLAIFGEIEGKLALELSHAKAFSCGIVVLCYKPKKS